MGYTMTLLFGGVGGCFKFGKGAFMIRGKVSTCQNKSDGSDVEISTNFGGAAMLSVVEDSQGFEIKVRQVL